MQQGDKRFKVLGFSSLLLFILPLFFASCATKGKELHSATQIEAVFSYTGKFQSISSNIALEFSSLGKSFHAKGYWYANQKKLRLMILNPLNTPQLDILFTPEVSLLLDYEQRRAYNIRSPRCADIFPMQEELSALLPLLFFAPLDTRKGRILYAHLDEAGNVSNVNFLLKKREGNQLEGKIRYAEYSDETGVKLPHLIEISIQGVHFTVHFKEKIRINKPIKKEVFSPDYFMTFKKGCYQ